MIGGVQLSGRLFERLGRHYPYPYAVATTGTLLCGLCTVVGFYYLEVAAAGSRLAA